MHNEKIDIDETFLFDQVWQNNDRMFVKINLCLSFADIQRIVDIVFEVKNKIIFES